ncbi:MAG: hypothetical protein JWP97_273, partial [Labilithrix sp.]|nr:hypothetical protein [Labilithrix sp.]
MRAPLVRTEMDALLAAARGDAPDAAQREQVFARVALATGVAAAAVVAAGAAGGTAGATGIAATAATNAAART